MILLVSALLQAASSLPPVTYVPIPPAPSTWPSDAQACRIYQDEVAAIATSKKLRQEGITKGIVDCSSRSLTLIRSGKRRKEGPSAAEVIAYAQAGAEGLACLNSLNKTLFERGWSFSFEVHIKDERPVVAIANRKCA